MRFLSTWSLPRAASLTALFLGGSELLAGCKDSVSVPMPPPLGMHAPKTAATVATLRRPIAATTSPDGKTLYVTALDMNGQGQIMSGAVGGTLSPLSAGVTLSYPCSIAMSSDGATILVADLGDAGTAGATGAVYRGSATGGLSALTMGTPEYPTAVAFNLDDKTAYLTGSDPMDGKAGVWSVAVAGGTPTAIVTGAPLVHPAGVVVANDGSLYVADTSSIGGTRGAVYRIQNSRLLQINKAPLKMHFPAGLAAAGSGYFDLLITAPLAVGTEPYLYQLSPDGTLAPVMLGGGVSVTEATTVTRAAKADSWVLVNGVVPAPDVSGQAGVPDPAKLNDPDGTILQLTP